MHVLIMHSPKLTILLAVMVLAAVVTPLVAKSGNNASLKGKYPLVFRGAFEGSGEAQFLPNNRFNKIDGTVTHTKTGQSGQFKADKHITADADGRFEGTGTVLGRPCRLVGRIEPGDGVIIKKARIIITFCTNDDVDAGRVLGQK